MHSWLHFCCIIHFTFFVDSDLFTFSSFSLFHKCHGRAVGDKARNKAWWCYDKAFLIVMVDCRQWDPLFLWDVFRQLAGYYLNIIWAYCIACMDGMESVSFQAVWRCSWELPPPGAHCDWALGSCWVTFWHLIVASFSADNGPVKNARTVGSVKYIGWVWLGIGWHVCWNEPLELGGGAQTHCTGPERGSFWITCGWIRLALWCLTTRIVVVPHH